ncbi:MAG: UDP-N-acetylmuramoyl-L-alanine--D-glutamate ligase [Acidimicrobiales bacterium]
MTTPSDPLGWSQSRPLVVGFAVTGQAMTAALVAHGAVVTVVDDHPAPAARRVAELASVDLVEAPSAQQLATLVAASDAVLPSPGVPDRHPVFAAARAAHVPVLSEFDLAAAWDDRPLLAITGTDGKTTVTTLVTEMLEASGRPALAVGNTDVPLVEAITRPDLEVFVVEASSFRLGHTRHFEPAVATWLNFAEDHLDVHDTVEGYRDAKARIWADLGPDGGVAVANADDAVVMARRNPRCRTVTFGVDHPADYHLDGDALVAASGETIVERGELWRDLPHDVSNALAASATALEGGASLEGVRQVLRTFAGLAHRVSLVTEADGIAWYDDSKATAPHATLAALRGFTSVVLIAGGHNKGLDLSVLTGAADHLRAVVAIGDAADELVTAFHGVRPVQVARSMADAVRAARALAEPGDVVLLSPGCASFDWYTSYGERGDDFAAAVTALVGSDPS